MEKLLDQKKLVVFDLRDRPLYDDVSGPLARVCGIPALVRTILLLDRQDYTEAWLFCREKDRNTLQEILAHPRLIGQKIRIITDETEGHTAQPVVKALGELNLPIEDILIWPGHLTFGRQLPRFVELAAPVNGAVYGDHRLLDADSLPFLMRPAALGAIAEKPLKEALDDLREEGVLLKFPLEIDPTLLFTHAETKQAEKVLMKSLRKQEDGVAAQYDRYISLAISRFLMRFEIHPNWVTLAAALVGIICGVLAAQGGYVFMFLGALFFQLNSIFDGIDGEIARAKLLESKTGQWLDTISDDFSNVAFVIGAGIGCARTYQNNLYFALGMLSALSLVIASAIMYHYLLTIAHSGDLNAYKKPWESAAPSEANAAKRLEPQGTLDGLLLKLQCIVRRDVFVVATTVFALIGELRIMMWLYAIGATLSWMSILFYPLLKSRTQPSAGLPT